MLRKFLLFVRAASISALGRFAAALVTASFLTFVVFQVASLAGMVGNAYAGLILYLGLPALFLLGLLLLPVAWWRVRGRSGMTVRELLEDRFGVDHVEGGAFGAPLIRTIAILTLANFLFVGVASMRGLHFMESAEFCGTACHAVMSPEWTTYQASPHARVACVECHVGEGVEALLESKLQGAWQVISATFDLYERPIPTPVHTLRPARETCEKCHWPEKFYGNRLKSIVRYEDDEVSTPLYTTLSLKIDARGSQSAGIHWHVAEENQVRYASVDDARREMIWVESRQPDGSFKRYENRRLVGEASEHDEARIFDCVDCHNRATHIYENPDFAVDERIRIGAIDRRLPFVKRESVAALTLGYPDRESGLEGIANHMRGYYRRHHPAVSSGMSSEIDAAVAALQEIYERNIHPRMNITWGSYPSFLGHEESEGCFRCHNSDLRAEDGSWIDDDCTLCHSLLAHAETNPFAYLEPTEDGQRSRDAHEYLRREFLESFHEQ